VDLRDFSVYFTVLENDGFSDLLEIDKTCEAHRLKSNSFEEHSSEFTIRELMRVITFWNSDFSFSLMAAKSHRNLQPFAACPIRSE
jgi:hypothetical protein